MSAEWETETRDSLLQCLSTAFKEDVAMSKNCMTMAERSARVSGFPRRRESWNRVQRHLE